MSGITLFSWIQLLARHQLKGRGILAPLNQAGDAAQRSQMSGADVGLVRALPERPRQTCLAISRLPRNLVQSYFIAGLQGDCTLWA